MSDAAAPLRIVLIEDCDSDAELTTQALRRAGLQFVMQRVQTEPDLLKALEQFKPQLIVSDFELPQYRGDLALKAVRQRAPHVPFLFLTGKLDEASAIDALHGGAVDYVLKSNLGRLATAVRRAAREAAERQRQEAQIARLNRVLRMQSGVNGAMLRIRDRAELLREVCRLAVSVGGYAAVVASAKMAGNPRIQPVAWQGSDEALADSLRTLCAEASEQADSVIGRALRARQRIVCNDARDGQVAGSFNALMAQKGLLSMVALPILVDDTPVGALLLTSQDAQIFSNEELRMLEEVAGNLSFAWQYMQKDTTVRFLSHFDAQTGLAKRALFCDRITALLAELAGRKQRYAVTVVDIERLGLINDSFGRRTGDLLLQQLAARLKRRLAKTEQLAHFGGGIFAMLQPLAKGEMGAQLVAMAQADVDALAAEPYQIEQRPLTIALRAGIACSPQDAADADTLVQHAEGALLHARSTGARVLHYDAGRQSERVDRLEMENRLRLAIQRREFELLYQPKVNVITRRIQGVEALVRWHSPDGGVISPGAFLPIVESAGLGPALGNWVIEQAAHDCQQWQSAGLPPIRVAVNLSPTQLQRADFTTRFLQACQSWSNSIWGLDIEVTEAAMHEDGLEEINKLKLLRKTGVKIAIDDFGTGYSSLGRLSILPVDTLKIDSCFIRQVPVDAAGRTVVKTIVALGRGLNLSTVAEGVENQEQLDFLWQLGCDQSQGYLHSKPIVRDEFATLLQHGKGQLVLPAESAEEATERVRAEVTAVVS